MATRPSRATLEQIRVVFWGMHEVPDGKKWRYFTSARSFWETLTPLEVAVCKVWYEHATEANTMATVCFELRKILQQHVDFEKFDVIDACFVRLFPAVYAEVVDSGRMQDLQVPAHTRPFERQHNRHEAAAHEAGSEDEGEDEGEGMGDDL